MNEQQVAVPTIEEMIGKYIEFRDAVERETKALKAKIAPWEASMRTIETYLMGLSLKTGQTTFGTPSGTAYRTQKTACNVEDWEVTLPFIINGNTHMLNKAVNKTAVGEYVAANGTPPPGVKWIVMEDIQVRRPS